jgi:hypothetical protein
MWTLVNQWDMEHTTEVHDGPYRGMPASITLEFAGEPVWATTQISAIRVHDDDEDFAAIYFSEYRELNQFGRETTVDVDKPNNKFKKRVAIGSETMTSLTCEADSTNIGARGVLSVQFWKRT